MTALTDPEMKRAWHWLKVTTPYRLMLANPALKAVLSAIARNLKKDKQ